MQYLRVYWSHDLQDTPVVICSEIDANGYETRKVEEYRDGRLDYADSASETGSTWLSEVPMSSIEEIAAQSEFSPTVINRQEFEDIWHRAIGDHRLDHER